MVFAPIIELRYPENTALCLPPFGSKKSLFQLRYQVCDQALEAIERMVRQRLAKSEGDEGVRSKRVMLPFENNLQPSGLSPLLREFISRSTGAARAASSSAEASIQEDIDVNS
jgi:hypothetical protein